MFRKIALMLVFVLRHFIPSFAHIHPTHVQNHVMDGSCNSLFSAVAGLEVERTWVRARRPGPNFRLALHKAQARKRPNSCKAQGQAR